MATQPDRAAANEAVPVGAATHWTDLNVDLGEGYGVYTLGADGEVLPLVTSANVACGFHASDPMMMRRTVELARRAGVAIGAHPSYPDRVGFGRRAMGLTPEEIEADLIYQVGALRGFCTAAGVPLHHVKAHGALYNRAMVERTTADAVVRAIAAVDPSLIVYAQPASALAEAALAAGLTVAREGFPDRSYEADGTLSPRQRPASVIDNPTVVAERAVQMATHHRVYSVAGDEIELRVDTLCVHGDNPAALAIVRTVREALTAAGVTLQAPSAR